MKHFCHIRRVVSEDPNIVQLLNDEYLEYQSMAKDEIPDNIWDQALIKGEKPRFRMDIIWGCIKESFQNLSAVALTVLTVPRSNAGDERCFSVIKKNKTEFLSTLKLDGSLNSIMRIKMVFPESICPCYDWKPTEDLLRESKKATQIYNEAHCSKSVS